MCNMNIISQIEKIILIIADIKRFATCEIKF